MEERARLRAQRATAPERRRTHHHEGRERNDKRSRARIAHLHLNAPHSRCALGQRRRAVFGAVLPGAASPRFPRRTSGAGKGIARGPEGAKRRAPRPRANPTDRATFDAQPASEESSTSADGT